MFRVKLSVAITLVLFLPALVRAADSDAEKIKRAMSAAPPGLARNAAVMEIANGKMHQLRAGSNGWVCFPGKSTSTPSCVNKEGMAWMDAWMNKRNPKLGGIGFTYMLQGHRGGSNTDPFATAPTATNKWVVSPPCLMVFYPDLRVLDAFPTDPKSGGPWVMWKGTPYAHLMLPVSASKDAVMPHQ